MISFKNEQVTIKIKGQERKLNMKQGDVKIKQRTECDCQYSRSNILGGFQGNIQVKTANV